jgi:pimeloyl-ACP methyl ester carboxylesterase
VIWLEALLGSVAKAKLPIAAAAESLLFSEGLPPERRRRYISLMQPESPRALADAHLPGVTFPGLICGVPTLVLGGSLDRLVSFDATLRTALYHGSEHDSIAGIGHFMQLDLGAEMVASRVVDWLDRRGV